MKMHTKFYHLLIVFSLSMGTMPLIAQGEVSAPAPAEQEITYSDKQLTKFAQVTNELELVQKEVEAELDKLLADVKLDKTTFTKMASTKMQGGDISKFTETEQAAFEKVQVPIKARQQEIMGQMMKIAQKYKLDLGTFRTMSLAISRDPALAERVEKIAKDLKAE
jgi:hypothetical protein